MLTLVLGGAASGKSAFAERLSAGIAAGAPLVYLAAMDRNSGGGAEERIRRHRAARAGLPFRTVELLAGEGGSFVPTVDGREAGFREAFPPGSVVLLEDAGNLVARAMFGGGEAAGAEEAAGRCLSFVRSIEEGCAAVVVVSNEISLANPDVSDSGMRSFLLALSRVNAALASRAVRAVMVVAGIPVEA